jgi:hypothetical protein
MRRMVLSTIAAVDMLIARSCSGTALVACLVNTVPRERTHRLLNCKFKMDLQYRAGNSSRVPVYFRIQEGTQCELRVTDPAAEFVP